METEILACNQNWLENVSPTVLNIQGSDNLNYQPNNNTACIPLTNYYYPYYYHVYVPSPARPIKLKLSEIEKLRKTVKKDKELKDILMKFTELIEITVDF